MKYLIISFFVAIIVAIFSMQNSLIVVIKFMQWEATLSLVLLVLISAALGALAVLSPLLFIQFSLRNRLRKSEKNEILLRSEITSLKDQYGETIKTREISEPEVVNSPEPPAQ